MDARKTGDFIAQLRKSKNLKQVELAEKLHVSGKAVSKWETGRSMPDISLLKPLSQILGVTINELLSGEFLNETSEGVNMDRNLEELIGVIEKMKKNRNLFTGVLLFILGIVLSVFSRIETASNFGDFISGLAIGLSTGAMIIGVILVVYGIVKAGRTK